jgi:acyl-CoA thioesterase-2
VTPAEPFVELDDAEEAEVVPATVAELVDAITAREAGRDVAGRPTFTTTSPEWWVHGRVFGGMVVAQALNAAMHTVPPGLEVHSLHGYFLRPTSPGSRTTHVVESMRDGRSFSTRQVTSEVEGRETFRMTCSFHVPEDGDSYQLPMAPEIPPPGDVNGFEAPFSFDVRELGTTERREDGTYNSTRRCWFRTREQLPDDPAVHAGVLAYFSDMTGASFRPHSLGVWGTHTDASLDHALWFHRPWRADVWSLFDIHALVNAGGRATVRATMHGEDGTLHLSMAQELLIRELDEPLHITTPSWVDRDAPTGGEHGTA